MNKKKILDNYKKEIKKYQKYSEAYYDKNNPLISDSDFDEIKKKIFQLEKENRAFILKDKGNTLWIIDPTDTFNIVKYGYQPITDDYNRPEIFTWNEETKSYWKPYILAFPNTYEENDAKKKTQGS